MFLGSNDPDFPAILKNESGDLLAEGRASISKPNRCVNFTSDFVPLYPVGTPMKIIRIHEKKEVHRFSGTVYLSDKQLMRLVSIRDEILPGAEAAYCNGFSFPATLTPAPLRSRLHKLLFSRGKQINPVKISISGLTPQQFEFQFPVSTSFEVGQEFLLEVFPPLTFPPTPIVIKEAMVFGANASYLCDLDGLEYADQDRLHDFLVNYLFDHEKLC